MSRAGQPSGAMRYGIGGLVLGLVVGGLGVSALNVLDAADNNRLATAQEATLTRLRSRLEAAGTGRALVATTPLYLKGSTRLLAAAGLQQFVVQQIEKAGGKVIETQDVEPSDVGSDGSTVVRVTFDALNDEVAATLYAIEAGLPVLDLDEVGIRNVQSPSADDRKEATLRVDVAVRGYWRAPLS